jgi:predicted alpha/beta superfamily hydrolase
MKLLRNCTLLLVSCMAFNGITEAQTVSHEPDSLGPFFMKNIDTWTIFSRTINEDFTIYVLRTEAYDTSNIKLPVLYMTDGDWNMTVARNCFTMLRQDYDTREPLIVGIGYGKGENKRVRDLDPANGGPAFLTFIEKELMPFIEKHYRITDEKAIYGYSMGGMFTTYILFNRPDLFDMVFIGAPGNNGRLLLPAAKNYFQDHKDLKSKVFIGVGSYESETAGNIDEFTDYLLSMKCPDLVIRKDFTPGAGHGAALAQVMQNAIAFAYCDRHEPIALDPSIMNNYIGKYISEDKSMPEVIISAEKKKLYWKFNIERGKPNELLPLSTTEFFMLDNQRVRFSFEMEANKATLVVTPDSKTVFRFNRE